MSDYVEYDLQNGKHHPYHLVNPSPWPVLSAFSAGLLAVGLLLWFHDVALTETLKLGWANILPGLAAVLACMFFWWRSVLRESMVEKVHNHETERGLRYGMALFISSEFMFFVAFFWAFFDASTLVGQTYTPTKFEVTGGQWPPVGIHAIEAFGLPFLMTMILLLSGCTVTWAHAAILNDKKGDTKKALWLTVALGTIFLFFQGYEYHHAEFGFADNIYTSTFFMATGFHGFHVLVGTIFLMVCGFRALAQQFTPKAHFGFEAAAWYWHFVDVIWLFLFVAIYFWGNTIGVNLK
ncbi:MAG: cytochrome c oxidase subunit 3 [Rhodospirillales bacterium]|nr:cytochrome c oxidase subunit 3 [Rhodospirillales bacterium]MCB9964762.1 cytochrome c oxidase subunit 3 [Rhodospirillales bacterium]MCB9973762.1 cytochrome c oxidase subunit 3 [Rhodospirillales bacterium]MCB9980658.1 cytochrome c oxidase subunit 3 [Rhodospirillales bacterium]